MYVKHVTVVVYNVLEELVINVLSVPQEPAIY
jgi:hypothetical protein